MRTLRPALAAATLIIGLAACASPTDTTTKPNTAPPPPASSAPPAAATTPGITPEQNASIRAEAGLPPTPSAAKIAEFIAALDAIDPDIAHGKVDKAVSRAMNQCADVKRYPADTAKQVSNARQRFSSPSHPEGRDAATAERIVDAVRKYVCPAS